MKFLTLMVLATALLLGFAGARMVAAAPSGAATDLKTVNEGCSNSLAKARLSWTASGKGEQRVDLSTLNNGFASGYSSGNVSRTGNAMELVSLQPGTKYYVRVVTSTASGALISDTLQFTASCDVAAFTAPTNLQAAAASNGTVRFSWTKGQNNQWFCVDTARNLADLNSRTGTWRNYCRTDSTSMTVTSLRCGATYVWTVYAWNGALNAKSAPVTVKTPDCVIGKPTDLSYKQTSNDVVRLSWTAGQNNKWFCVDVAESEKDLNALTGTWENFGCWQTKTTLDLTELECGKVYYFNVYAWNESVNTRSANSTFELTKCKTTVPSIVDDLFVTASTDNPAHYILTVVIVLPNDCYKYDSSKVSKKDTVLNVTVTTELNKNGKCSKKAQNYEVEIDLGTKFESGKRYTVNVNSDRVRFTAE